MKKTILLLMAGCSSISAFAQPAAAPAAYTTDRDLSRWVLDANLLGGAFNQKMDMANTAPNYLNGINIQTGNAAFRDGGAVGGDLQLGYFFGRSRHWGLGTGVMYLREWGTVTLDKFHAEYQSVDNNGAIFRQVVSSNAINEQVKTDNVNIPLMLKYRNRFSKRWGFTADAGALFNVKMKQDYSTDASFDYEAIYKFAISEAGTVTPVYDNSVIPDQTDFLITRSHFSKNNPQGSVQEYFNAKAAAGYNVGLNVKPGQQKGTAGKTDASVGFMLRPSVNYFFSDKVALNVGGYYLYQSFTNEGTGAYTMTGKPGEYSSIVNSASKLHTQSFGGNVGLRFFLGRKASGPARSAVAEPNRIPEVVASVIPEAPRETAPVVKEAIVTKPVMSPEPVAAADDRLSQILFAFNTSDIRPESYAVLDQAYAHLLQDGEARVIIDGNTDKIGTDDYNQRLSDRRAAAVKTYLMKKGISAGRISQRGNGEREPVATNSTGEGRRQNRRAELLIRIGK